MGGKGGGGLRFGSFIKMVLLFGFYNNEEMERFKYLKLEIGNWVGNMVLSEDMCYACLKCRGWECKLCVEFIIKWRFDILCG